MDKIEKVARALAVADMQDPDEVVNDGLLQQTLPNWQRYMAEATRFVAATEALTN